MRAANYVRYSDDNSREESIIAQLRICREYCAKKKYTVVKEYIDEAKTGRTDKRPGFQKMLADAQAGLFDVLVVHKVNRFARNRLSAAINKNKLASAGVRLEYVELQVEGKHGVILESVLEGMAEYYSLDLADEVMKGMTENALQAKFNGGNPPFGYDIKDGKYFINPHEEQAVKMIFNMVLSGKGYGEITDKLDSLGYKTKHGNRFAKNSLHDLLKNERYTGTYIFNKVKRIGGKRNSHSQSQNIMRVPNAIPALISRSVFDRVQELLLSRKKTAGGFRAKIDYHLRGLIFCGDCGSALVGTKVKRPSGKIDTYYYCNKKQRHVTKCRLGMVPKDWAENETLDAIDKRILKDIPKVIKDVALAVSEKSSTIKNETASLKKEKINLQKKLDNLYSILEDGADEFDKKRLSQTKERLTNVRTRLLELEKRAEQELLPPKEIEAQIYEYRELLKTKDPDKIGAAIRKLVDKVIVKTNTSIEIHLKFGCTSLVPESRHL